jgi:hypothetical protein
MVPRLPRFRRVVASRTRLAGATAWRVVVIRRFAGEADVFRVQPDPGAARAFQDLGDRLWPVG